MRAAIMLSIGTGVRLGELLRLQWADIDFAKQTLTVHLSKTGKSRSVYVPSDALQALRVLKKLAVVSPTSVFLSTDGVALTKSALEICGRKSRAAAGLTDVRWHDLRHTAASLLAQNGATLSEIGSVLGHSTPGMTQPYAHLVDSAPVRGADKLNQLLSNGAN